MRRRVCFPSDMECCAVRGQADGMRRANGPLPGSQSEFSVCHFFVTSKNPLFLPVCCPGM